jgi:uncharacterized protein
MGDVIVVKMNFFERFFPVKYDFHEMLNRQAETNSLGVNALYNWLCNYSEEDKEDLFRYVIEADNGRMELENKLIEAFVTPFDRSDIYTISVAMDKIIEYAKSTLESMIGFEVKSNESIIQMVMKLKEGTDLLYVSIKSLKDEPYKSNENIAGIRATHVEIENIYRKEMALLFKSDDPMHAIKNREVLHHIKDASLNLDYAVDIFHKIVVRRI